MSDFLVAAYPWIKALHIVSIVAWMAGLLYLLRLFVYHADALPGSDKAEKAIMERRLLHGIMNPALAAVVVLGGLLAATPGVVDWRQGCGFWAKLALVFGLAFLAFITHLGVGASNLPRAVLRTRRASFVPSMNCRCWR